MSSVFLKLGVTFQALSMLSQVLTSTIALLEYLTECANAGKSVSLGGGIMHLGNIHRANVIAMDVLRRDNSLLILAN